MIRIYRLSCPDDSSSSPKRRCIATLNSMEHVEHQLGRRRIFESDLLQVDGSYKTVGEVLSARNAAKVESERKLARARKADALGTLAGWVFLTMLLGASFYGLWKLSGVFYDEPESQWTCFKVLSALWLATLALGYIHKGTPSAPFRPQSNWYGYRAVAAYQRHQIQSELHHLNHNLHSQPPTTDWTPTDWN